MSGEKCSHASFVDTAARLIREAQQRAQEAEERARREREAAQRRLAQLLADCRRAAAALQSRIDALLADPRSRFADIDVANKAQSATHGVVAALRGEGMTESRARELASVLESLDLRIREQERITTAAINRVRSLEQIVMRAGHEFIDFAKSEFAGFSEAGELSQIEGMFAQLRAQIGSCDGGRLDSLESAVADAQRTAREAIQHGKNTSEGIHALLTRLHNVDEQLTRAALEFESHWIEAETAPIRSELGPTRGRLQKCRQLADARALIPAVVRIEERLSELTITARARQRMASLAAEEAALEELNDRFHSVEESISRKFGGAEFDNISRRFTEIRKSLEERELERGSAAIAEGREQVRRYLERVAAAVQEWTVARNSVIDAERNLATQWSAIRGDAELRKWLTERGAKVERDLVEIARAIEREDFTAARSLVTVHSESLENELRVAKALRDVNSTVIHIQEQLEGLHELTNSRFDVVGRDNVGVYLAAAGKALSRRDVEEGRRYASEAARLLSRHREVALAQHDEFQRARDAAAERVAVARDAVAAIEQDAVVCRWKAADVRALAEQVARASASLEAGRFGDAVKGVEGISKIITELVAAVAPLEAQFSIQRQLAVGIEQALRDLGFVCDSGEEVPGNPSTAIILQAERHLGLEVPGKINVAVEPSGRLEYNVGGAFTKDERYDDRLRRPVSSCDEAERQLLELHAVLGSMGIKTGKITWEGQPPPDDTGSALLIPDERTNDAPLERTQRSNLHGS
jgi:hypothetical protein